MGAASTRGQMILPKTIALFQKRFPNISVELTEGSNGELHQKLLKGTIDLAIADFPENLPGISLTDLWKRRIYFQRKLDRCDDSLPENS